MGGPSRGGGGVTLPSSNQGGVKLPTLEQVGTYVPKIPTSTSDLLNQVKKEVKREFDFGGRTDIFLGGMNSMLARLDRTPATPEEIAAFQAQQAQQALQDALDQRAISMGFSSEADRLSKIEKVLSGFARRKASPAILG